MASGTPLSALSSINRGTQNVLFGLIFSFLDEPNAKLQMKVRKDNKIGCIYVLDRGCVRIRLTPACWSSRWHIPDIKKTWFELTLLRTMSTSKVSRKIIQQFQEDLVNKYTDRKLTFFLPRSYLEHWTCKRSIPDFCRPTEKPYIAHTASDPWLENILLWVCA